MIKQTKPHVLIVDDDQQIRTMLARFLGEHGMRVTHASDGISMFKVMETGRFDVIVLDVMMPGEDGFTLCRKLRAESAIPLILLTARNSETDRIVGLELGADDYVGKPFSPRELLARLRAVLRRARPDVVNEQLQVSGIAVDVPSRSVTVAGAAKELTGIEFDILVALMRRAGRVVPRDALLAEAGRSDVVVGERTVDVHISHLRQKLGDDPPRLIKTVRGVGYVLAKE